MVSSITFLLIALLVFTILPILSLSVLIHLFISVNYSLPYIYSRDFCNIYLAIIHHFFFNIAPLFLNIHLPILSLPFRIYLPNLTLSSHILPYLSCLTSPYLALHFPLTPLQTSFTLCIINQTKPRRQVPTAAILPSYSLPADNFCLPP